MTEKNTIPVYDFLGYRILDIKMQRKSVEEIDYFRVRVQNPLFSGNIFTFQVVASLKFPTDDESSLLFDSGFRINDLKWKKEIGNDDQLMSIFFSAVFPFIREKIFALTDDNRHPVIIPILDLRCANLTKGIEFTRKKTSSVTEQKNTK